MMRPFDQTSKRANLNECDVHCILYLRGFDHENKKYVNMVFSPSNHAFTLSSIPVSFYYIYTRLARLSTVF